LISLKKLAVHGTQLLPIVGTSMGQECSKVKYISVFGIDHLHAGNAYMLGLIKSNSHLWTAGVVIFKNFKFVKGCRRVMAYEMTACRKFSIC
jgi:hypothetical protein